MAGVDGECQNGRSRSRRNQELVNLRSIAGADCPQGGRGKTSGSWGYELEYLN